MAVAQNGPARFSGKLGPVKARPWSIVHQRSNSYQHLSDLKRRARRSHGHTERTTMKTFLLDESRLELSEYAVAAALVAIAVAAAFTALGDAIGVRLNQLATRVTG